jgi:acetyl-CoA carboxylase carboxyltransferase component
VNGPDADESVVDVPVWQPELDELRFRLDEALAMGGQKRVERQRRDGRLTARDRIDALIDPGTFHEFGALAGTSTYDKDGRRVGGVQPTNAVTGRALVDQRPIAICADDFTVKGGSSEGANADKWIFIERWALEHRTPMVRLVDAAGGSIRLLDKNGATKIPGYASWPSAEIMAHVPVVGVAMGPCAGLGAMRVAQAHFSVMVAGTSQVFAGGPAVVAPGVNQSIDKEELGGFRVHARGSGVVDNEATDECDALQQVARFLSYLPTSVFDVPPHIESDDDPLRQEEMLASVIPRDRRQPYKVRDLVAAIFDKDSLFEIGKYWGRSTVTMFARLNGHPVGVIANDPMQMAGTVTTSSADKLTRFIDLCDTFHVPIVNLVDQPGVYVGKQAEAKGTLRHAIRTRMAIAQTRVPWSAVFLRRAFGVGGGMYGPLDRAEVRLAWPSARWGSIPIEGGVEAAFKRELAESPNAEERREELFAHYRALESPFRTAEKFGIEEIIDPRNTRALLCEWVSDAYRVLPEQLGVTYRTFRV